VRELSLLPGAIPLHTGHMADDARPTAFVTGASGFLGSELVRVLVARGYQVFGLASSVDSTQHLRRAGAIAIRGDLLRIVRINAVPRERVYGRSFIRLRSPSPTAQISESSRRMMPDCSSVRPDKPGFKRGNVAAEAHGGRGDQKVASAAASI
jgi:NAD(P)-dependent dehydrogenase (short-subunit alcohol dehydrogenase family)